LHLAGDGDAGEPTARVIDLVAPLGKGQRGLVVAPPNAGTTTLLTKIAAAIERQHPEVTLVVLALDARPEEVTELRATISSEVVASTFERPGDEHAGIAELELERAKRLVETGSDVVILIDGITQLGRAHHLAAPVSGRAGQGAVDVSALLPTKQFFAAARNTAEAGSLTIVAVALVDTNSRLDEAILQEVRGAANWELRLDRRLADGLVHPAIDVSASGNRRDDRVLAAADLAAVRAVRAEITSGDDERAPVLRLLERVAATPSNSVLLGR
jgi:transcription termination factor Rho